MIKQCQIVNWLSDLLRTIEEVPVSQLGATLDEISGVLAQYIGLSTTLSRLLLTRLWVWTLTNYRTLCSLGLDSNRLVDVAASEADDYFRRVEELCFILEVSPPEDSYRYLLGLISLSGDLIAHWKYTTNVVFTQHYKIEPPKRKWAFLLGDRLLPRALRVHFAKLKSERRFLNTKSQIHVYTLFQGFKKGLVPARMEQVATSLREHSEALSRHKVSPPAILSQVERILTDLFKEPPVVEKPDVWNTRFSRSATIELGYGPGGNVGYAIQVLRSWGKGCAREAEFLGYTSGDVNARPVYATVYSDREVFDLLQELKHGDLASRFARGNQSSGFHAMPSCILEPMKVRIITKPRVGNYHGMRVIQRTIWRALHDHPSGFFRLIGESLNYGHLAEIVNAIDCGKKFVSGDFKASTDNLNADFSREVARWMLRKCEGVSGEMAFESLFGAIIHYQPQCLPQDDRYLPSEDTTYHEREQFKREFLGSLSDEGRCEL